MKNLIPRIVGALSALALVVVISPTPQAQAKRMPAPVMQFVGYQIQVEPEVTEPVRGRLVTRALVWKFRSIFENRRTKQRVAVITNLRDAHDSRVRVKRPWEPSDAPRMSRIFRKERKALRRFAGLRNSPDITLLKDHHIRPPNHPQPQPQPQLPPPPPAPTCKEVLLKKGHSAIHLNKCRGTDQFCAVELLRAGHSPIHLDKCRTKNLTPGCVSALFDAKHSPIHLRKCQGVQRHCAVSLLNARHSPIHLDKCQTPHLSPRCVTALFAKGHSPIHVSKCGGVDGSCAQVLLRRGQSPIHLQKCRK